MTNVKLVKLKVPLNPKEWHGSEAELLWAEPLKDSHDGFTLRIKNSPGYAFGLSYLDVVRAVPSADGSYEFKEVIQRGGHSTYMLLVPIERPHFEEFWKRLNDLGCTYESSRVEGAKTLFSVDIPGDTDIYKVYDVLKEGEEKRIWDFQEGHVGHQLRGTPSA